MKAIKFIIIAAIVLPILFFLCIWLLIKPPSVKWRERREVKNYVEKYLTNQYGDHKFKVIGVRYQFESTGLFDYSNPTGYTVDFHCDVVKDALVFIDGLEPNKYHITGDTLLKELYYGELDFYEKFKKMEEITPTEQIELYLSELITENLDSDIYSLECSIVQMKIPDSLGRIPSLEELKNDISFYEIFDFHYYTDKEVKKEEYIQELRHLLSENFGGNWDVNYNPNNGYVSCFKIVDE